MKKLIFTFIILSGLLYSFHLTAQNKLTVNIKGIKKQKGHILISLADSSADFMKQGKYGRKAKIKGNTVKVEFTDIPKGKYAVSLFQDENDNNKLDKSILGMPKEKYGFSNNPKTTFGPPKYEECVFSVEGDTSIEINL